VVSSWSLLFPASMPKSGRNSTYPRCSNFPSQLCELKLTAGEFNLLVAFLEKPREVLSREQLLLASRVRGEEVYDRSVDVVILRLRRKLEADPANPRLIKTFRGAGYFFEADVDIHYGGTLAA
ncbi:winged helix-turn-helix domain-containing protein, partial [Sinorhizobium meliloti]|uniref:winged helix-turn-helix domain-containing protein n=1 Tax=Rhizobium meliloti TaxID=382 RepID=UPI001F23E67D